jgi:hypothetical protein
MFDSNSVNVVVSARKETKEAQTDGRIQKQTGNAPDLRLQNYSTENRRHNEKQEHGTPEKLRVRVCNALQRSQQPHIKCRPRKRKISVSCSAHSHAGNHKHAALRQLLALKLQQPLSRPNKRGGSQPSVSFALKSIAPHGCISRRCCRCKMLKQCRWL